SNAIFTLVMDPSDPTIIYAGTLVGAWKTTDNGDTWSGIVNGLIDVNVMQTWQILAMAVETSNPSTLYAGNVEGFFKSTNGGRSWTNYGNLFRRQLYSLTVDLSHPGTIYAGSGPGVYKSTDEGATWMAGAGAAPGSAVGLAVDPQNSDMVYDASLNGARRTTDGGKNWSLLPIMAGGFGFSALSVAVNPFNPNIVYIGTSGGGVFKSTDRGNTWSQFNAGLTNLDVRALAVDPINTNMVYAGTSGGGVFSIQLLPVVSSAAFNGKNVTVAGENFSKGATILMNGVPQRTIQDAGNPGALIGKKLVKKITPGQTVTLQVQNPDGTVSNEVSLTRPT